MSCELRSGQTPNVYLWRALGVSSTGGAHEIDEEGLGCALGGNSSGCLRMRTMQVVGRPEVRPARCWPLKERSDPGVAGQRPRSRSTQSCGNAPGKRSATRRRQQSASQSVAGGPSARPRNGSTQPPTSPSTRTKRGKAHTPNIRGQMQADKPARPATSHNLGPPKTIQSLMVQHVETRAESGKTRPIPRKFGPNSAKSAPKLVGPGKSSAHFGPDSSEIAEKWSTPGHVGRTRAESGRDRQHLVNFGKRLAECGPKTVKTAQVWPNPAEHMSNLGQSRPTSPNVGRIRAQIGRNRTQLDVAEIGPCFAEIEPDALKSSKFKMMSPKRWPQN